jgi:hypothetical protein
MGLSRSDELCFPDFYSLLEMEQKRWFIPTTGQPLYGKSALSSTVFYLLLISFPFYGDEVR